MVGYKKTKRPKNYIGDEVINIPKQTTDAKKNNKNDLYIKLKWEIKCKLRRDKINCLKKESAKINEHNENRKPRELFEQIKKLKKTFTARNQYINDDNGKTLTKPEAILKRWHE